MYYRDASGIEHESYSDACRYYGADTPEDLAMEDAYELEEWLEHCADHGYFPTVEFDFECPF